MFRWAITSAVIVAYNTDLRDGATGIGRLVRTDWNVGGIFGP